MTILIISISLNLVFGTSLIYLLRVRQKKVSALDKQFEFYKQELRDMQELLFKRARIISDNVAILETWVVKEFPKEIAVAIYTNNKIQKFKDKANLSEDQFIDTFSDLIEGVSKIFVAKTSKMKEISEELYTNEARLFVEKRKSKDD